MDERDERKRTSGDASKRFRRHQNWSCTTAPGRVWREPTYWPRGVRCIGGMTLIRALVRNLRTCPTMSREKVQAENLRGRKYRCGGQGADCSVIARKRGNARGAKGAGHRRWERANWQQEEPSCLDGRRRSSFGGTSRMMREYHVRICERLGVKLPGPTRQRCGNVGT